DEISRGLEQEDERRILWDVVSRLPVRERQIMEMRFGMNGYEEYTQKQVADTLGISQSYISRLEKRIIGKLKKQIEKAV
ncbi:MAG: sigma-70 family RNA polymerase sigma factor, partial [Clostridia bacterium]|nr:sigma-70 family RNA polymerase sigma factor [Clostridia bacterium]